MYKIILHTFDYELFLGLDSGSADKCLIEPTQQVLNIFNKHKIKHAIFFVDTMYLWRLKEESKKHSACYQDYNKIIQQLKEILKQGHYLFIHIHPHWLDAAYNPANNRWILSDYTKYKFQVLNTSEKDFVFKVSIEILNEIIDNNANYILDAYRAGGWCIQPFSDFKPYFEKYGIKHDFSVIKNFSLHTSVQSFDFSKVNKDYYRFSEDITIPDNNGTWVEYTTSVFIHNKFSYHLDRIANKFLHINKSIHYGDGKALMHTILSNKNNFNVYYSLENMNFFTLPIYINRVKKNSYSQFLSHPKMLSVHNLKMFDMFCEEIYDNKIKIIMDYKNIEF